MAPCFAGGQNATQGSCRRSSRQGGLAAACAARTGGVRGARRKRGRHRSARCLRCRHPVGARWTDGGLPMKLASFLSTICVRPPVRADEPAPALQVCAAWPMPCAAGALHRQVQPRSSACASAPQDRASLRRSLPDFAHLPASPVRPNRRGQTRSHLPAGSAQPADRGPV
jgi:hypothetical protein